MAAGKVGHMDAVSIAASAVAANQAQTRAAIQTSVIKQAHAQQAAFVEMIAEQVKAAPPPGTGGAVDVSV